MTGAPSSTYRLQIRQRFPLSAAGELADYLSALGVGAIYLSPILQATSGSDHGYDITSHQRVDPERGGEDGRLALTELARAHGLSIVIDIVPNHLGVADAAQNEAWWQLLRLGQESPYASWFDVDWQVAGGRLRLPVLGDDFSDDQLSVVDGELRYFDNRFPIAPDTAQPGDSAAVVHDRQHYELVGYRRADAEQNYRRFFAVTELAGIRVEDPAVFEASHAEILRWVDTGGVDGIRIDHPDGLADPAGYLKRLAAAAPDCWITVEKITEPGELLPADWPVAGTTGYDALAELNALLYDPAAEAEVSRRYTELTGDARDWDDHIEQGKRLIATTILRAELLRIVRVLRRTAAELAADDDTLLAALTELAVAFGVYRSYHPVGAEQLTAAVALASARHPELATTIGQLTPLLAGGDREVTVRFEQATGAIMAKGVEDTAYYRYNRAIGLNEVGGDPGSFGSTIEQFHAAQSQRQRLSPASMTTLSTHDTKRSEDVRARLAVLPELAEQWYRVAGGLLERCPIGNAAFGYLLWQTFAGAGWIDRERMHAYAEKAMREAADGTGWRDPDAGFEAGVHEAIDRAYDDEQVHGLLAGLIEQITPYGWSNSLSQKLLQLTMPGVPDVYQGTELFDYCLVDPDNRRPVDFDRHRELLALIENGPPPLDESGAAKLWLVHQALTVRRDRPELLSGYQPLAGEGPAAQHLVAFDRGGLITLATRLPHALAHGTGWQGTELALPEGSYRDLLTGREYTGRQPLTALLADYPVALLASIS
ncbi:MAG: malto-oligosyltrehalose synthase [Actinomycetota bacterium]|nr:malto-oligosyltrehalose synthase [Actinomycetota bacterium]MDQ2957668.1 malto-oligosyltrehalose synthase [Actinomycetota bacterium]